MPAYCENSVFANKQFNMCIDKYMHLQITSENKIGEYNSIKANVLTSLLFTQLLNGQYTSSIDNESLSFRESMVWNPSNLMSNASFEDAYTLFVEMLIFKHL